MIDFWEILGRTVMDKVLREKMYGEFAKSTPATPYDPIARRVLFKDADYVKARQLMATELSVPVSLFGLGEWLMMAVLQPISQTRLDAVATAALAVVPPSASHGPVFYQALGAMIIDGEFLGELIAGNEAVYGFRPTPAERASLQALATSAAFVAGAKAFHEKSWDHTCEAMVIQPAGAETMKYHHPVEPWDGSDWLE